jgi:alkylation response protein AidB-like acyl-CoA dehydrogenase
MNLWKNEKKYPDSSGFAPEFDDTTSAFRATAKQPAAIVKEARKVVEIARAFTKEVIKPSAALLDSDVTHDPNHLPWEFVKKANEWGLYTLFIPKLFGGKGYNFSCANLFFEELGTSCLAMANLVGVHYLGYTMLTASWNLRLINRVSREIVEKERNGELCLLSLAMTEPDAGTDSQNVELMDTGNLRCLAKKVPGGYRITGTKIFISCGHLSTWHVVHAYTDSDKASENTVMLLINTNSEGFSFGKKESKMGQKGCPASELIFNNCFVPDDHVCIDNEQIKKLGRSPKKTNEQIFAYIWGASRASVGTFGVAGARGAYETALAFAKETSVNGSKLINQEWCQSLLAQMYLNVATARTACYEATQANAMHGLWKVMNHKPIYYGTKFTPTRILNAIFPWICEKPLATTIMRKVNLDYQKNSEIDRVDGWGSIAKVAGTDASIKNCQLALELMGQSGLRQNKGLEKIVRDTRLLQIYEGTNEINMLNIFKRMIQNYCPESELFSPLNL